MIPLRILNVWLPNGAVVMSPDLYGNGASAISHWFEAS